MQEALTEQGIKEQAVAWIQHMNSGLTSIEKQQLVAWINQNELHHKIFVEQTKLLDNTYSINELSGVFPISQQTRPRYIRHKFKPIILCSLLLLSLIFCIAVFHGQLNFSNFDVSERQHFQTSIGERSTVTLTDGTEITLNTDTIINVSYSNTKRIIELVKGEAFFDVAKDKRRPFVVLSGEKSFTALGTIFNIEKSNTQDMELIVTEGRVLVGDRQQDDNVPYLPTDSERLLVDQSLVVAAGKKSVIVNNLQVSNAVVSLQELNRDLAWQSGGLIFSREPLLHVLEEVSRYSRTKFEVTDPQILSMSVSGYFKVDDIDGLLNNLQNNLAIEYKRTSLGSIELSPQNKR